jgi:hypothetical protein
LQLNAAYTLLAADQRSGPFEKVANGVKPSPLTQNLELPMPIKAYYRLQPLAGIDNFTPWLP